MDSIPGLVWQARLGPIRRAALTNLFATNAALTLSGGGLASSLVWTVQLTSSNTLKLVSGQTNFIGGSVNLANGLMTVIFHPTNGGSVTAYGTILQNTNLGGGFFVLSNKTISGTITLTP